MAGYDVIVIGGGGAGITAAAAAAEAGVRVAIVCKEPVGYGNTRMAVGLTACAGLPGDTREAFIADILASGEGLCSRELVETLVEDSRSALAFVERLGHVFTRSESGHLSERVISRAGGHSRPRTLQSSGSGIGMAQALRSAAVKYGLELLEDTMALELCKKNGMICGVRVLSMVSGEEYTLDTHAVVLATGGAGSLFYPQTSNNRGSSGDGYALAFRVGAYLTDMEQVQAIPFGITHPEAYRGLVCGEPVVAGPAGRILDGQGNVVLERDINRMSRAAVVRAMATSIAQGTVTEHGGLQLDLRPNLCEGTAYRDRIRSTGITDNILPAYGRKAYNWEEPWDVLPTAHFMMGGIAADKNGATNIPGLFVAGEAMGGVHGANRLGSVALTEILVYGLRAGRAAAKTAVNRPPLTKQPQGMLSPRIGSRGINRPVELSRKLQRIMWEHVGLVRNRDGLQAALDAVAALKKEAEDMSVCAETVYNMELRDAYELEFMLDTANLVLLSARYREESRGAHLRSDFPESTGTGRQDNIMLYCQEDGSIVRSERGTATNG